MATGFLGGFLAGNVAFFATASSVGLAVLPSDACFLFSDIKKSPG